MRSGTFRDIVGLSGLAGAIKHKSGVETVGLDTVGLTQWAGASAAFFCSETGNIEHLPNIVNP